MKDLFTIQTESGQLWLDIKAQLDAKDAAHAAQLATANESLTAVTADRDRIAELLAEALAAFDAGDVAKLKAMREDAQKTENEKKLATALAKKAEAEAEIASLTE
ncbi:MAG: hypothetical protein WCL22_04600 [bacterium]